MSTRNRTPLQNLVELPQRPSTHHGAGVVSVLRGDGWVNRTTGLGVFGRDKQLATDFERDDLLVDEDLENLYHGNDVAARIVESLPDEAMRKPFEVIVSEDEDESADVDDPDEDEDPSALSENRNDGLGGVGVDNDATSALARAFTDLDAVAKLKEAAIWARTFGGSVVFIGADDGRKPEEPLDETNIKSVTFLNVIDRRYLFPIKWYEDPFAKGFGEVEVFELRPISVGTGAVSLMASGKKIHSSRLIIFGGALTTYRRRIDNHGWDLSVLQKPYRVIRQFDSSWDNVGNLLQDAAQGVYSMKDYVGLLAAGQTAEIQQRLEMMDYGRSNARALVIDADTEEFHREAYTFAGIPDVLQMFMLRLASAARTPVTILMGQSPSGLNATGESDLQWWYETAEAWQTLTLKPRVERLAKVLMLAKTGPTGGVVPNDWQVKFQPIKQMTEEQKATIRKTIAEADVAYVTAGVLTSEDVAINRFRKEGWSMETFIDIDMRKQIAALDAKAGLDRAKNPPDPNAPPEGEPGQGTPITGDPSGTGPATPKSAQTPKQPTGPITGPQG